MPDLEAPPITPAEGPETPAPEEQHVTFDEKQKERVNVPVWFGVGTIAFGVAFLLVGRK